MLRLAIGRKVEELSGHEYYREVLHVWLYTQCTLLGIDPESRLVINEEFTLLPGEYTSSHENDLLLGKIYAWIEEIW